MSDELLENIKLPQELSRDTTNLQCIASDIRRSININDPGSLYYQRPDLAKEAELRLRSLEIRAGATQPQMTPEKLAAQQHEQHWSVPENKAFEEMMLQRAAELNALGDAKLQAMASDLRREMGSSYLQLLAEAKVGLDAWGETLPLAVQGDVGLLRVAAAKGRFKIAKARR